MDHSQNPAATWDVELHVCDAWHRDLAQYRTSTQVPCGVELSLTHRNICWLVTYCFCLPQQMTACTELGNTTNARLSADAFRRLSTCFVLARRDDANGSLTGVRCVGRGRASPELLHKSK